ncbi:hypothetical protein [Streptomyces sp. NPDC126933]|uniref:hypothetical protein n=1 Tax=unclassified Streptomyces TaxID=2593676 RepID=UPI003663D8C5
MAGSTRVNACEGYRRALAAHAAAAPVRSADPGIAEAVERQTRVLRALSRHAFPEPGTVPDVEPARSTRSVRSAAARLRRPRPPP